MASIAPGHSAPSGYYRQPSLLVHRQRQGALASGGLALIGFFLVMLFNLALPKGGTRIETFPITWGYLVIAGLTVFAAIGLLRNRDISLPPILQSCCLMLPIAIIVYYKAQHFNMPKSAWLQYAVLFGFFPIAILVAMGPYLERLQARHIAWVLRNFIRFAVAWGLFNFLLFLVARQVIEVPYLTVNGSEAISVMQKNNMRGSVMKLVSSYNNGNIFGVCMVMLMPLYFYAEKKKIWLAAFVIALLCTLSRTVWFAMTGAFILMVLSGQIRVNRMSVWVSLGAAFCVFLAILPMLGWTSANLIDDRLGGRLRYLRQLEITFMGQDKINIPEVVYYGLLQSFGLIGFVIAIAALSYGVIYGLTRWNLLSPMRRAAVLGAVTYLFACTMDGAFVFPPVFPLFLFINAMIYRRGYRASAGPAVSPVRSRPANGFANGRSTAPAGHPA